MCCTDDSDAERALQAKLYEKSEEALRIRIEIQRSKLDTQMMRLQLQVQGIEDGSLIPSGMGTGGKLRASDLKWSEHKRLLEWLAENIDMSSKQAFNVPDPEVNVGGHRALLGQMVQWILNVPGGLRLSAPVETERDLLDILQKTASGLVGTEQIEEFADDWLLVTTDLVADSVATPALFLIHKQSQKAIVVSAWPNIFVEQPAAQPVAACFDPATFFQQLPPPLPTSPEGMVGLSGEPEVSFIGREGTLSRLHCPAEGGMFWSIDGGAGQGLLSRQVEELGVSFSLDEQFTIAGPFGFAVIADPMPGPMQRWLMCGLVALALDRGVRVHRSRTPTVAAPACAEAAPSCADACEEGAESDSAPVTFRRRRIMSSGDSVEVKYKGSWLKGVLQAVQGEMAHVKCDVDENGVITVAPLNRVRLADFDIESAEPERVESALESLTEGGFGQC